MESERPRDEARSAPTYRCDDCGFSYQLQEGYEKVLKVACPRCGKPPSDETSTRTVTR
jgi:predicted RNA-binding Zn-ribbon protein involved in translation (DUF1610 family)